MGLFPGSFWFFNIIILYCDVFPRILPFFFGSRFFFLYFFWPYICYMSASKVAPFFAMFFFTHIVTHTRSLKHGDGVSFSLELTRYFSVCLLFCLYVTTCCMSVSYLVSSGGAIAWPSCSLVSRLPSSRMSSIRGSCSPVFGRGSSSFSHCHCKAVSVCVQLSILYWRRRYASLFYLPSQTATVVSPSIGHFKVEKQL